MIKAQVFHYKIVEVLPITELERFKDHHRLQTFYHKGCKCVECGLEATVLAKGEMRGQVHWDVYTADFYPLTVDHIIPKSKGGPDELDNYQPMCARCNHKKGNGDKHFNVSNKLSGVQLGQFCVWPNKNQRRTAERHSNTKDPSVFVPVVAKLINSFHNY